MIVSNCQPLKPSNSDHLLELSAEPPANLCFTNHTLFTSPIGYLLGGPLADYVLEPAMQPGGSLAPVFGGIFGTGAGAGMALLYVSCAICMLLIGLAGYAFPVLRDVEKVMPDHDAAIG